MHACMAHTRSEWRGAPADGVCHAVQELAVNLMGSQFGDPAKWRFMAPYRQSLPDPFALYGKYNFLQEHLPLLQDDKLARRSRMRLPDMQTHCTLLCNPFAGSRASVIS